MSETGSASQDSARGLLERLEAVRVDLETCIEAVIGCDEQHLADNLRRTSSDVLAVRAIIDSENAQVTVAEGRSAVAVKESAMRLSRLLQRVGGLQRTRLRVNDSFGGAGYMG